MGIKTWNGKKKEINLVIIGKFSTSCGIIRYIDVMTGNSISGRRNSFPGIGGPTSTLK